MKTLIIGLVVLLVVVSGAIYFMDTATDESNTPIDNTPTSTTNTNDDVTTDVPDTTNQSLPTGFRLHAEPDGRYHIALPFEVDVSDPRPTITRYRYVGPQSEPNTEITDGYTITVTAEPATATSLAALTEQLENDTQVSTETITATTLAETAARRYESTSALGNQSITHYALLPGNGYQYDISVNIIPDENTTYQETVTEILNTIDFVNGAAAETLRARIVPIAMLDYSAVGSQYTRESAGKERGCDRVVLIEHALSETPADPLEASLQQLFSYTEETVGGWQNFIASHTDTLSFERATIVDGTAQIYLTGSLGPLGGVCDNPRAAIQIEETALAYDTVSTVEIYLNNEPTDLRPGGRGE